MQQDEAEIIIYGGDIITMDDGLPKAQAVAVSGEKILDVGSIDRVFRHKGTNTQVIFLNRQTLMPGFIEPHQHAILCAKFKKQLINIGASSYRSYHEIQCVMETKIKELAAEPEKRNWGLFFGWDPELIPDLPTLSAAYLDANYPSDVPLMVIGQNFHVAWVNTKALEEAKDLVNKISNSEMIIKDDDGKLTGKLYEVPAIFGMVYSAVAQIGEEIKELVCAQWKDYASVGLTTVTEMLYRPNPAFDQILKTIADSEECPIRLGLYRFTEAAKEEHLDTVNTKSQSSTDKIEETGIGGYSSVLWEAGVKIIADGSPHCGTAAVREPYLNTPLTETLGFPKAPGYGKLNYDKEALCDTVKKYHLQGKQIAIHCHGERAVEQVLKAYEEVLAKYPGDSRHRMEHLGLITPEQIARAGKINLALSFFVDHLRFYALVYKTDIFGDRVNRWTPLSEATKSGVTWTIHQDHPAFPGYATPFSNMKTAVTRCTRDDPNTPYGPEYRVSIHEALKAYTINAAWQLHREDYIGSITIGKKADLVVLSENPYDVDPFDLERIQVIETFLNGHRNNLAQLRTVQGSDINVLDYRNDA